MTTSYSDLEKEQKLKTTPISDVLGFITVIANTHALAKVFVLYPITFNDWVA